MQFKGKREDLLGPLAAAAAGAEGKTLPILTCLLLEGRGESLAASGTDLEMEVIATASVAASGKAAVPAKKLVDVIRALPAGAEVAGTVDGEKLVIKSGRSRFSLSVMPAENFPAFSYGEAAEPQSVDPGVLAAGLAATSYAMAVQDVRYYLNGLLLRAGEGELMLVASDGHRLAKFAAPCEAVIPDCIVPRGSVLEIMRAIKGAETVALSVGRPGKDSVWNTLALDLAGLRIGCKLVEGRFPDWQRVWPRAIDRTVTVDRLALLSALEQAALVSSEKYKSAALAFAPDGITIQAANPEHDEAEVAVAASLDGAGFEIGFNAAYLAAALGRLSGETVTLGFPDARNSCLVADPDDGRQGHIVMPMSL